jgi:hypothetical protein
MYTPLGIHKKDRPTGRGKANAAPERMGGHRGAAHGMSIIENGGAVAVGSRNSYRGGVECEIAPTSCTRPEAIFCKGRAQLSHKSRSRRTLQDAALTASQSRGASTQGTGANVEVNERQGNAQPMECARFADFSERAWRPACASNFRWIFWQPSLPTERGLATRGARSPLCPE